MAPGERPTTWWPSAPLRSGARGTEVLCDLGERGVPADIGGNVACPPLRLERLLGGPGRRPPARPDNVDA
eukprot:8010387-Pyramimonas_sp.AAC.1